MPGVQSASYPVFFKGILMRDNRDFTTGRILSPLIRFMIPVFFAMLLQAMYGAVDLIIVGQFGHSSDVSAVSTGSQMMMTITNLVTSFAIGTTMIDCFHLILLPETFFLLVIGTASARSIYRFMQLRICTHSCELIVSALLNSLSQRQMVTRKLNHKVEVLSGFQRVYFSITGGSPNSARSASYLFRSFSFTGLFGSFMDQPNHFTISTI